MRTKRLPVAIAKLDLLLPMVKRLKALVISSRTLETDLVSKQLNQIKDTMLKQLTIADIDPLIAKLEQGYSEGGHTINALGTQSLTQLDDSFKERFGYIAEAESSTEREARFDEIVTGLEQGERWAFIESFSSIMKLFPQMKGAGEPIDALPLQAKELLFSNGFKVEPNSVPYRVLLSKLKVTNAVLDKLLVSILDEDFIGELNTQDLLLSQPQINANLSQVETPEEPSGPLFSQVYAEFLEFKIRKEKLTEKIQKDYERFYTVWQLVMDYRPIEQYRPKDIGRLLIGVLNFHV